MEKDYYIVDVRVGCIAVYLKSREGDTNGCHKDDDRNVFYKEGLFKNGEWFISEQDIKEAEKICDKLNNNIDNAVFYKIKAFNVFRNYRRNRVIFNKIKKKYDDKGKMLDFCSIDAEIYFSLSLQERVFFGDIRRMILSKKIDSYFHYMQEIRSHFKYCVLKHKEYLLSI